MRTTKNSVGAFLPYLGLVLSIVLPWFFKSGYLFFTDMSAGPNITVPRFTASGFFYYHFATKLLNYILPADLIQKLIIAAILGMILFGGHRIARSLTQDKGLLFLGSAFALFNPFVYDRSMYGQIGIVLAYAFFLTMFGYLIAYYLNPDKKKFLFLASIFAGLTILPAPHFSFFVVLVYFVFGILFFIKIKKNRKELFKITCYFILAVLFILLINFNWLYGVFANSNLVRSVKEDITQQDLTAFRTVGKSSLSLLENVFLMSGFWGMEQHRYENLQNIKENWGRSFYFLLPVIIFGLLADFRNKEKIKLKVGLMVIYAISFILSLGIALPLTSKIIFWMFKNIPFYKGLREPQKWVAVIAVVYEILLVFGLIELFKKKIIIKHRQLLVSLLIIVIILQAPLLVWGGAGRIKPINYPADWYEINKFISSESYNIGNKKCQNKILFLPWHMYMHFEWIGKIVANPAGKFFECPVIYGKNMEFGGIFGHSLDKDEREVEKWVFSVGRTNLFQENKLNIGYIILAKEVDWRNYSWLGNHPNVEFVNETENLMVYKVHPVK